MINMQNSPEITTALAGIFQAIHCVISIAKTGTTHQDDLETLIRATLTIDANSTEAIFGNYANLYTGFNTIIQQLDSTKTEADFGRYLVTIFSLEKQLSSNAKMLDVIGSRIAQTARTLDYQNKTSDDESISQDIIKSLADLYQETLSTLPAKIQVVGQSKYLEQSTNQQKIRALLLSAIRSAVLWRQVGGKKRQFIFSKNQLIETAKKLML